MAKTRIDPPDFDVKEVFDYRDGCLFWKQPARGRTVGKQAGFDTGKGYLVVNVKGRYFYTHRLVYLWHTGKWPDLIDHIDCDRSNNKIENLREADKSTNAFNVKKLKQNNKSGFNGVYWNKALQMWSAQCSINGKIKYIGSFSDVVEAANAIKTYRKESE